MHPHRTASITQATRGGKTVYRVDLGKDEKGKRIRHEFHLRDSAESFKKICEEAWVKGLPTPTPDLGLPPASSPAKLYKVPHRSGKITYRIAYTIKGGKRFQRGFDSEQKALQFQALVNEKFEAGKKADLVDLAGAYRHEILVGVEKLRTMGATIIEAVDFYIKFAKPIHGNVSVRRGVKLFLEEKRILGRSPKYLRNCEEVYFRPFESKF